MIGAGCVSVFATGEQGNPAAGASPTRRKLPQRSRSLSHFRRKRIFLLRDVTFASYFHSYGAKLPSAEARPAKVPLPSSNQRTKLRHQPKRGNPK